MASLLNNLGGTLGFGEYSLTRNDDSYQTGVSLTSLFGSQGLNFFGTNYTYVSVNNNGNITLSNNSYSGLSAYTPFGLANGGYAIIAPFLADVDTRLSGGTANANQVTPTAGGTSRGSDLVWYDLNTSGYGTLTVTWDDVGYYSYKTDKLNTFQLQIIGTDNIGNFDIVFRYESINWTTGSASSGVNGLGGTVARAGYSTGDGASWYELAQSGLQDSMLALETTPGNTGLAGYYRFSVRSGTAAGEVMNGTSRDDLLAGAGGNDTINGFAGNDYLIGNAGNDRLLGGTGNDTYTTDGTDTIVELANAGTDMVMSSVSYTLGANLEDLSLTGSSSVNATGNSLANVLAGNSGNNTLNGMGGSDTVDYSLATYGITVNLGATSAQYISGQGSDTLVSIENIIGSIYNDNLTGTSGNNVINGNVGNDTMVGGAGSDTYYVDSIYDVVTEAAGAGTDTVLNSLSAYTLGSNVENGRILSAGTASLTGNTLNNVLFAGRGSNVLSGGSGTDTVDYRYSGSGVTVDLNLTSSQATGGSGSDRLSSIEQLTGSNYGDSLTGNAGANRLSGLGGNDMLDGGAGNDVMIGGDGSDRYLVRQSGDVVSETNASASTGGSDYVYSYLTSYTLGANVENGCVVLSGTANLTGNSLSNVLYAGAGNNVLNGGAGVDTVDYRYAGSGVTARLSVSTAQATGGSGSDALVSIENLTGSAFGDLLAGTTVANRLSGSSGNDTLAGGLGNDVLVGGSGNDIFLFNTTLSASTNKDTIADFGGVTGNNDRIYLDDDIFSALGTAAGATPTASKFVANAAGVATTTSQRIVYDTDSGALYYDSNGSGAGGQVQFATLTGHPTLTVADFFVVA